MHFGQTKFVLHFGEVNSNRKIVAIIRLEVFNGSLPDTEGEERGSELAELVLLEGQLENTATERTGKSEMLKK